MNLILTDCRRSFPNTNVFEVGLSNFHSHEKSASKGIMKRSKLRKRFLKEKSEACAKAYTTQRN